MGEPALPPNNLDVGIRAPNLDEDHRLTESFFECDRVPLSHREASSSQLGHLPLPPFPPLLPLPLPRPPLPLG